MRKRSNVVKYNKWGYIFLIPFIVIYVVFQLVPLISTVSNSFFENYRSGLTQVGPNFIGLENYKEIFSTPDLWKYFGNTMIMWVLGFVPQILISERVKAKNKDMIYSVQAIRRAIDRNKKISFRYLQYNTDKQQVPKQQGTKEEEYVVSPYATVWNDDRYYLVGWSDKRRKSRSTALTG